MHSGNVCFRRTLLSGRIATDAGLRVLTHELFDSLDTAGTEQFSKSTRSWIL
jgi:hypothetical protein